MSATGASLEGQTIVDNSSPDVPFWVNPQYADVTDTISAEAYELVKTAETSAYNQTLARITSPKWSFSYRFTGASSPIRTVRDRGVALWVLRCGEPQS